MLNFLRSVFMGPPPHPEDHLVVRVYLAGGQVLDLNHVKTVETTKTEAGGFASYKIVWHDGYMPALFTVAIDHISAIVATKG